MELKIHHSSVYHDFHLRHYSYGNTVRLAKRWLHSHMFSRHFNDEIIELLVAYLYAVPRPYDEPHNPTIGFLRFLHLLSTFDFDRFPLIVDINKELKVDDYSSIQAFFERAKIQNDAKTAIFVATPYEKESIWTHNCPSKLILKRIIRYAQHSEHILQGLLSFDTEESTQISWKTLFQTPFVDFDAIIQLDPHMIPYYDFNLNAQPKPKSKKKSIFDVPKYKNVKSAENTGLLVGFNPIENYMDDLQARFKDVAVFFYDQLGGDKVGVVWNPSYFLPHTFRLANVTFALPLTHCTKENKDKKSSSSSLIIPNVFEMLADLRSLGDGFVLNVSLAKTSNKLTAQFS